MTLQQEQQQQLQVVVNDSRSSNGQTAKDDGQPSRVERIYIGGMDPDCLTISQVLDRIPKSQVSIHSVSHPDVNPCYCHISATAITDHGDNPPQSTAWEIIQKLLHNVKWKGCKIQVQAARPHFLERLRMEQEERTAAAKASATMQAAAVTSTTARRYYRVRFAYGKPAWLVDSKPYQVTDAKMFRKMVQHVRKRRQQQEQKPQKQNGRDATPKKPYRAVHWSLEAAQHNPKVHGEPKEDSDAVSLSESSTSSSSSSSASSKSYSSKEATFANKGGGNYVWSDDESSTDSNFPTQKDGQSKRQAKGKDDDNDDDASACTSQASSSSPSRSNEKPNDSVAGTKPGKYEWSDDEESSSNSDDNSNAITKEDSLAPRATDTALDEFAAALEGHDDDSRADRGNDEDYLLNVHNAQDTADINMEEDEARNLRILAGLFPEMAETIAKDLPLPSEADKKKDGWNASGLMMRYDPTKASSKQLEQIVFDEADSQESPESKTGKSDNLSNVKDDSANKGSSTDSKELDEEEDRSKQEEASTTIAQSELARGDIYRQDDLENVFREARESQSNRSPVIVENEHSIDAPAGLAGGFSFGFSLEKEAPAKESTSFSFGFDVPTASQQSSSIPQGNEITEEVNMNVSPRKRRKLNSSFDDLDNYIEAYLLDLNEGQRIANDLNAFRNDPSVQEDWDRQRQKLTLDWKAKRKHTVARKQKHHG